MSSGNQKMDSLDLLDGIDDSVYGRVSPKEELCHDFKPWHKPRKHWIRLNQWNRHIGELLSSNETSLINYFSLPGKDAIDIRTIGRCLPVGKKLCFYGLECKENAFNQSITDSLLRDYDYISGKSKIEPRTHFEDLGNEKSKLTMEIVSRDPFHIINLDFTDSIFSPTHGEDTIKALLQLLTIQFDRQYCDWFLFITTRCNKESIDLDLVKKCVLSSLAQNYKKEEFRKEINQQIYQIDKETYLQDEELLTDTQFEKIVIISLLKIILENAVKHHIEMEAKTIYSYSVDEGNEQPDMLSVALKFKKHITFDDASKIIEHKETPNINEVALGKRIIACVSHSKNVDRLLNEDVATKEDMIQQTKELLKICGYDITRYPYD